MEVAFKLAQYFNLKFRENKSPLEICSLLNISKNEFFKLERVLDERIAYFMTYSKVRNIKILLNFNQFELSSFFKSSLMLKPIKSQQEICTKSSFKQVQFQNIEALDIKYVSCEVVQLSRVINAYKLGDCSKVLLEPLFLELEEDDGSIYPIRHKRRFNEGIKPIEKETSFKEVFNTSRDLISNGFNPIIYSKYYDYALESYFNHYALIMDVNSDGMLLKDSYNHFFPELLSSSNSQVYRVPFDYLNSEESYCKRWLYGSDNIRLLTLEKVENDIEWRMMFDHLVRESVENMLCPGKRKGFNAINTIHTHLSELNGLDIEKEKDLVKLAHLIRVIVVENRYIWYLNFSRRGDFKFSKALTEIISCWIGLSNSLLLFSLKGKIDLNILNSINKIEELEVRLIEELKSTI